MLAWQQRVPFSLAVFESLSLIGPFPLLQLQLMEEDHQYQEKGFEHSEISDTSNGDDYHRQILGLEEEKVTP